MSSRYISVVDLKIRHRLEFFQLYDDISAAFILLENSDTFIFRMVNLVLITSFLQIVKYFLDPLTFQKVKFVYPKKEESVELMKSFFDVDNLPNEFGGKATLMYDHEEFSRLMAQDDVKTAEFWGLDEKPSHISNSHSGAQVAPEPTPLAVPAS